MDAKDYMKLALKEAQKAFFYALNKRRPFCVKDTVPQTFILDMHKDCR